MKFHIAVSAVVSALLQTSSVDGQTSRLGGVRRLGAQNGEKVPENLEHYEFVGMGGCLDFFNHYYDFGFYKVGSDCSSLKDGAEKCPENNGLLGIEKEVEIEDGTEHIQVNCLYSNNMLPTSSFGNNFNDEYGGTGAIVSSNEGDFEKEANYERFLFCYRRTITTDDDYYYTTPAPTITTDNDYYYTTPAPTITTDSDHQEGHLGEFEV